MPFVKKDDIVTLKDKEKDFLNETFEVETIKYSFGRQGYRQILTLGDIIN